jgi:hypothetical protein
MVCWVTGKQVWVFRLAALVVAKFLCCDCDLCACGFCTACGSPSEEWGC